MVLRRVNAAAVGHPHHHRATQSPAGAVAHAGGVGEELVDGWIDEAHELNLGDGPETGRCEADGHTDDRALGERRVDDSFGAEALYETVGGAKYAAVHTNVLAEHDDPLVSLHLLEHGIAHRLRDGLLLGRHLRHRMQSLPLRAGRAHDRVSSISSPICSATCGGIAAYIDVKISSGS